MTAPGVIACSHRRSRPGTVSCRTILASTAAGDAGSSAQGPAAGPRRDGGRCASGSTWSSYHSGAILASMSPATSPPEGDLAGRYGIHRPTGRTRGPGEARRMGTALETTRRGAAGCAGADGGPRRVGTVRGVLGLLLASRVLWPLALMTWLAILQFTAAVVCNIRSRRDLTVPEGSIVYSIREVAAGRPLYRDFRRPPYATTPYPPLYYLAAAAPLAPLRGGTGIETVYLSGRLVTLLSTLVCLGLATDLARRAGAGRWSAAAPLLAATSPCLIPWGFTCRPDFPALALTLAGIRCFLGRRTAAGAAAAAAWFLAALLTKQSFVAAPLAMTIGALADRSWARAGVLLVCMALGGMVLFTACDRVTGDVFYLNVVGANVAPLN